MRWSAVSRCARAPSPNARRQGTPRRIIRAIWPRRTRKRSSASARRADRRDGHRLVARFRPLDPLAGHARPDARAGGRHRRRAVTGRDRGLGRPAARAPGAGRSVGRQRVVAGPDRHVSRPGASAAARARSRERAGPGGPSASSASTSPGGTAPGGTHPGPTTASSRARSSRASTATSSRPARTSAST